jgi:hypothetical protein
MSFTDGTPITFSFIEKIQNELNKIIGNIGSKSIPKIFINGTMVKDPQILSRRVDIKAPAKTLVFEYRVNFTDAAFQTNPNVTITLQHPKYRAYASITQITPASFQGFITVSPPTEKATGIDTSVPFVLNYIAVGS